QYATSFCFELPAATHIYTLSLHDALPIYLVDHKQPLVGRRRGAELELCVRDDDAVRPGVAPARLVQREACLLEPLGERTTQRVDDLREGHVLVVPLLGFRGRGEDGRIEPRALDQSRG